MAEEKSPVGEIASGISSIFERIGEFFHIFDLSFFVGGTMTFGALVFFYLKMNYPREFPFAPWVGVFALIIACYICGLIAFAVGRQISTLTFRSKTLDDTLPKALKAHNLKDATINLYIGENNPEMWRLYIRMWSEIAHEKSAPLIIHHLMRYWAMSATYDTVAFSFIVWAIVLIVIQFIEPIGNGVGFIGAGLCLCASYFAFRRGANYYEYQIEDIVAHFVIARHKLNP